MLSVQNTELQDMTVEQLMIPAEKVAHVQRQNPLEHALLVLVKSGYSAVPVLDASFRFQGIISKTMILDHILGIERFEVEKLSAATVKDVMDQDVPTIRKKDHFTKGLKSVINHPFICVVDENDLFDGILTRRVILKQINRYLHEK
ncbi:CBS domain protein [Melghiribacillus thermohalophilus]|uniref:CBS domain protein n=1 Tax=Melghiribacillus thermohalophilus TaxID=1324956 RepID=A0A4R3MLZ8_9BACI|nr:cyclic-di-AMP-binding protein CbpB [Melghiribacillus thermohalophilus]TCT15732.1 CBS domain protein [Melghiribacillus thermohalophilus]